MTRQLRISLALFVALVLAIFIHAVGSYGGNIEGNTPNQHMLTYIQSHHSSATSVNRPISVTPTRHPLSLQLGSRATIRQIDVTPDINRRASHPPRNLLYTAAARLTQIKTALHSTSKVSANAQYKKQQRTLIIHVTPGQCLWTIAKHYRTTVSQLVAKNHLHTDVLQIGQSLQIPVGTTAAKVHSASPTLKSIRRSSGKAFVYIVQRGDTLWRISTIYGVSVNQLKSDNHLQSNVLGIGQRLIIATPKNHVSSSLRILLREAPARLIPVYKSAAAKYDVPWTVLAAIHKEETDFSTSGTSVSSAGAIGPMQFMPETFRTYGVAAPGHSYPNIHNVDDAIYSAAHMLAENGFNDNPYRAVFAYNQSAAYVRAVLHLSAS